jgi:hypothetical protein
MRILKATLLSTIALLAACSDGSDRFNPDNPFSLFNSALYSDASKWLCHPELADADNICASDLNTTVVFADGSTEIEEHIRAEDPEVDCFYVYPTVSADQAGNSDLIANAEEDYTVLNQAARYSSFCRVFAPIYRQVTVSVIITDEEGDRELAYADVLESFKHYIARYKGDRGFILIGHSQGAGHLRRLINEVIEPEEFLREGMIAAHILGSSVRTTEGTNIVSGTQAVELCRTDDQTGCMVTYVSYREGDTFVTDGTGVFGRPAEGETPACTNPAALTGGSAALTPYFPIASNPQLQAFIIQRADGPFADSDSAPDITTPFYAMPGFLSGACATGPTGIGYLRVSANTDPDDPRADDFNGEMILQDWGLHLVDMTVAMGDLVELGSRQAASWLQNQ